MINDTEKNEPRYKVTCRGCGNEWRLSLPSEVALDSVIAFGRCSKCSVGLDIVDMQSAPPPAG